MAAGLKLEHIYNIGVDVRVLASTDIHPVVTVVDVLAVMTSTTDCTINYKA
jgi:hypothetical protein